MLEISFDSKGYGVKKSYDACPRFALLNLVLLERERIVSDSPQNNEIIRLFRE